MGAPPGGTPLPRYDRDFLLSPARRNQLMALWEVQQFGTDSFNDPDYVSIHGMPPEEWFGRGIRLLARTTVEATPDRLGDLLGRDAAQLLAGAPAAQTVVIDPFAGSCNGLWWMLRHLPGAEGLGFELDDGVFALTVRNLALLGQPVTLVHGDVRKRLADYRYPEDAFLVVLVAPPWADALDEVAGLDLARTRPPVTDVVALFEAQFPRNPKLYVTQTRRLMVPGPLADYRARFAWSEFRTYPSGIHHAAILGTTHWRPGAGLAGG